MSPEQLNAIKSIVKRDGRTEDFNLKKIEDAIFQAAETVGGKDHELAHGLSLKVLELLQKKFKDKPTVDNVQDLVEKTLIEEGHARTAKAFILFRHQKDQELEQRALIIGRENEDANLEFSNEALKVLERRYLIRNPEGQVIETPKAMLQRVAKNIAAADRIHGASKEDLKKTEEEFYSIMAQLQFLPNSPTLMNAATITQQLSSCFVLPVEDNINGIFGTLKDAALIHQRGSGTGFSFSRLRAKGEFVRSTVGVAHKLSFGS